MLLSAEHSMLEIFFDMLQIPIYHSTSFPQIYPRVADSPSFPFESSQYCQTLPTQIRSPHSPHSFRTLPPKDYHNSKTTISFPSSLENQPINVLPVRLSLNCPLFRHITMPDI